MQPIVERPAAYSKPSNMSSMGLACFLVFVFCFLGGLNRLRSVSLGSGSAAQIFGDWASSGPSRDLVGGRCQPEGRCPTSVSTGSGGSLLAACVVEV